MIVQKGWPLYILPRPDDREPYLPPQHLAQPASAGPGGGGGNFLGADQRPRYRGARDGHRLVRYKAARRRDQLLLRRISGALSAAMPLRECKTSSALDSSRRADGDHYPSGGLGSVAGAILGAISCRFLRRRCGGSSPPSRTRISPPHNDVYEIGARYERRHRLFRRSTRRLIGSGRGSKVGSNWPRCYLQQPVETHQKR